MSRWTHWPAITPWCFGRHSARTPQARDDTATGGEDAAFRIDVLANDRGGQAKTLYSVDQDNLHHALTSTTLASGATISVVEGQILYDPGDAFQFLDTGESATDTFDYAIRLGHGRISTATVTVTIEGADETPVGPSVERVSVSSTGEQGNSDSYDPSLSADGRYVAYQSSASNLVGGDTNSTGDVFVHDRQTGITERVSVSTTGEQANGFSLDPDISADGRYVTYWSFASNLVEGDTNGVADVFVHDRQTGITERVSVASDGTQANNFPPVPGFFTNPSLSADGRYVTYHSLSSNLVPDDTNGSSPDPFVITGTDVFVHDRQTGITERVSVSTTGEQANRDSIAPDISADGRYVTYWSLASNLVGGDSNSTGDIFVHDRETGITQRVSMASNGTQANDLSLDPDISADGRYVAYQSSASNLVEGDSNSTGDIFVHDRETGITQRVSMASNGTQANDLSLDPDISADGRYVAYQSSASNLVEGDSNSTGDIFVHDRETGITQRVSFGSTGEQGNGNSYSPSISSNGRYVAYQSLASNLVAGDTNNVSDVFVASTYDFLV